MQDEVRHDQAARRFELGDAELPAVLEYHRENDAIVFTHTYVPPTLRGGGVAARLVAAGVAFARAEGLRIVPACSYVAAWLERENAGARAEAEGG